MLEKSGMPSNMPYQAFNFLIPISYAITSVAEGGDGKKKCNCCRYMHVRVRLSICIPSYKIVFLVT